MNFSAYSRNEIIERLRTGPFDLIIIGGGITGAGIALDAASRGLKTALIEKNDFAFGTSSRSTKLIHGGLRYLKQLEFALVKEVGSERAIVHRLAPHLVVPEKMLLPLYEKRGLGYWLTSIGLKIYDWLAGVKPEDQRRMLTSLQTLRHEPLLMKDEIKGGAIYAEYRTDDARLTIEIMKRAFAQGAITANYIHASEFIYEGTQVRGVKATDELTGQPLDIHSSVVVNAAGPWVDDLRGINHSLDNKKLHLTKGIHIVVPYYRLPVRQAIYFDVPDGRMIFAIPRGRVTYVGTTDTDYSGDKNEVFATREDVDYLLKGANVTFPSAHLTLADVESCWAGLRPLIHEEGKSASELSRKDEIFRSDSGLISMAGGKLTGYRRMAERVVDLIADEFFADKNLPACSTASLMLVQPALLSVEEVKQHTARLAGEIAELGLKGEDAGYLIHLFGRQADVIIGRLKSSRLPDPETALALAELWFVVNNEMICRATDFFVRRTGLLYFDLPRLMHVKEAVLQEMRTMFQWTEDRLLQEKSELDKWISSTLRFKQDEPLH